MTDDRADRRADASEPPPGRVAAGCSACSGGTRGGTWRGTSTPSGCRAGGYRPDRDLAGPVIVVLNHPSWWDPLIGLVLAGLWPGRGHFAPIDAAGLAKYPFLDRLGFFGIEPGTPRGAPAFLRQGLAVLAEPGATLWVTAQGRFADPRERPTRLKDGRRPPGPPARRGVRRPAGAGVPVLGRAHARGPRPVRHADRRSGDAAARPAAWTARLEAALQAAQDALAADARSPRPRRGSRRSSSGARASAACTTSGGGSRRSLRGERFARRSTARIDRVVRRG